MRGRVEVLADRTRRTLLAAENVKLLRIPPPARDRPAVRSRDGLYDVAAWDWGQVVWCGRLRFVQEEFLDGTEPAVAARVELLNYPLGHGHESVFGVVQCDEAGEAVRQTHSRRAFRVLIDHEDMKVALGLVFDDSSTANEFVSDIRGFKRDLQDMAQAKRDLAQDLDTGVMDLSINASPPATEPQQTADDDNDDDDDFGDFVSG